MGELKVEEKKLPPLQSEIIRLLGEKGALTKHEVAKELGKAYKNVLFAFNRLKEKGLINVVGEKEYRSQYFETYWLTWKGIVEAYALGVSIEKLRETVIEYLRKKGKTEKIEDANLFFNILEILGKEDSLMLLDMIDTSNGVPKLEKIPLSLIQKTDKLLEILKVAVQYDPYRALLEPELEELEKVLELYRKMKQS